MNISPQVKLRKSKQDENRIVIEIVLNKDKEKDKKKRRSTTITKKEVEAVKLDRKASKELKDDSKRRVSVAVPRPEEGRSRQALLRRDYSVDNLPLLQARSQQKKEPSSHSFDNVPTTKERRPIRVNSGEKRRSEGERKRGGSQITGRSQSRLALLDERSPTRTDLDKEVKAEEKKRTRTKRERPKSTSMALMEEEDFLWTNLARFEAEAENPTVEERKEEVQQPAKSSPNVYHDGWKPPVI
eukprot:TRINITY_DN6567_c0_g1_i1.p1 TRINITY_DN6567_c0_g1~~TRINITY_DN6567_c0_g1_i1.p1  ORF type:complete len:277 (-),score=68.04 TRINITY_DN6567_c0_g1_i1:100-825(-)